MSESIATPFRPDDLVICPYCGQPCKTENENRGVYGKDEWVIISSCCRDELEVEDDNQSTNKSA